MNADTSRNPHSNSVTPCPWTLTSLFERLSTRFRNTFTWAEIYFPFLSRLDILNSSVHISIFLLHSCHCSYSYPQGLLLISTLWCPDLLPNEILTLVAFLDRLCPPIN